MVPRHRQQFPASRRTTLSGRRRTPYLTTRRRESRSARTRSRDMVSRSTPRFQLSRSLRSTRLKMGGVGCLALAAPRLQASGKARSTLAATARTRSRKTRAYDRDLRALISLAFETSTPQATMAKEVASYLDSELKSSADDRLLGKIRKKQVRERRAPGRRLSPFERVANPRSFSR